MQKPVLDLEPVGTPLACPGNPFAWKIQAMN